MPVIERPASSAHVANERIVDDPRQAFGLSRLDVAIADDFAAPIPHGSHVVPVAAAERIDERLDVLAKRVDDGRHAAANIHDEHEVRDALRLGAGLRHGRVGSDRSDADGFVSMDGGLQGRFGRGPQRVHGGRRVRRVRSSCWV